MRDKYNYLKQLLINQNPQNKWDAYNLTAKFFKIPHKEIQIFDKEKTLAEASHDEEFLDRIIQVFRDFEIRKHSLNWSTEILGSMFVNLVLQDVRLGVGELHDIFTMPNETVSLPDIAFMYTIMDHRSLNKLGEDMYTPSKLIEEDCEIYDIFCDQILKRVSAFQNCFKTFNNEDRDDGFYHHTLINSIHNHKVLPCLSLTDNSECTEYCNWHRSFFEKWSMKEFITMMTFALPQRKLSKLVFASEQNLAGNIFFFHLTLSVTYQIQSISEDRILLAERLFGQNMIKNVKTLKSPWFLPLFCYQKDKGFTGENVGIPEKTCNEFFPTPSDAGICLTKNMDIRNILDVGEEYVDLFEPQLQTSAKYIESGSKWGQITLVLLPVMNKDGDGASKRKPNTKPLNVKLQLHQDNEFAQLFSDNDYNEGTIPLDLEYNNEYFIKVTPTGRISTVGLRNLDKSKRACKLENEVPNNALLKVYTEKNCRYECHVALAMEQCKCIPWDFISRNKSQECDVFGRTCFFQSMENLTQFPKDPCTHCVLECDYVDYIKEITTKKLITVKEEDQYMADKFINGENLRCFPDKSKAICKGTNGFIEFFYDENNTFIDKGYENAYNSLFLTTMSKYYGGYKFQRAKIYQYAIIVHLKFMQPKINEIGIKYTLMDKLALFGGNFGIFETITGCSLLGIINLMILIIKYLFSPK